MNKKILFLLFVSLPLILFGANYFYQNFQFNTYISEVLPIIKNTSIRASNALAPTSNIDSSITYEQYLRKSQMELDEIDKNLLQVQTISSEKSMPLSGYIVDYFRACQRAIRVSQATVRTSAITNLTVQRMQEAAKKMEQNEGSLIAEFYLKQSVKYADEASKQVLQMEENKKNLEESYRTIIKSADLLKEYIDTNSLINAEILKNPANKQ